MAIYRGEGGSGDATADTSNTSAVAIAAANDAQDSANAAAASAAIASTAAAGTAGSVAAAATSASNAASSASTATTQAGIATTKASEASTSATNAATSATNAANSATSAASSATTATIQASNASTSATNAATSATTSSTQAGIATTQATNAATSANSASTSASASATSATNAATSATASSASAAAASAVALGNEPVRHSVRPSLLLDFANTKQLDPRITFTRASTATFYDGKTAAKAEENLLVQSETFDNASWGKSNVTVTANSTTAPDGTITADTLVENTALNVHRVDIGSTLLASTPYVFSVYVKDINRQFITLSVTGAASNFFGATYDLTNVTVPSNRQFGTGYAYTSASITAVGNGWYRLVLIGTVGTTVSSIAQFISLSTNGTPTVEARGTESYTGTGASLYVWGVQLEQRSSVTAYTRTTTAAITNYIPALQTAASGVARFDHNPTTGESLGLLIEEQRVNLALRSEEFDNAAWNALSGALVVTPNTNIAPDGNLTADTITLANAFKCQSVTVSASVVYTFSVWLKTDVGTKNIQLREINGSGQTTVTATTSWQRFTFTYTSSGTTNFIGFDQRSGTSPSQSGTLFVWGAQLEAGAFATSYIPTVASQVTRPADAASMTGTNFSSWYRQDEGTMYAEVAPQTLADRIMFSLSTASGYGNSLYMAVGGSDFINVNNGTATTLNAGVFTLNTNSKLAGAYKINDFAASLNAATPITSTTGVPVSFDRAVIGGLFGNTANAFNGTLRKISYYPKRLTNAELQGLTTV